MAYISSALAPPMLLTKEDIIIRWGEWDKGAFWAIHVESDPEEPLVSSEDEG